ncbi:PilW family protein [Niveibacterium terrae]|uniref:PilW family protein n=1 Tax=Niveibacterium terrae TaxID=3373598 RepID=UPI003A9290A7
MISHRIRNHGFTLVELMVAMVVGLLISGVAIAVFAMTKNTSRIGDALSRYQEGFRFGTQVMSRDIRMAGYFGCNSTLNHQPADLISGTVDDTHYTGAIKGYGGTESIATLTNRVSGTDALRIQFGNAESHRLSEAMTDKSSEVKLNKTSDFKAGDSVVIADCSAASSFKLTSVETAGSVTTLEHTTASNSSAELAKKFDTSAEVYALETTYFYVAQNGERHLLMRKILRGSTMTEEEIADGIMDLKLLYGIDTDSDTQPNKYVKSTDVTNWNTVSAVRLCMISRSENDNLSSKAQKYYDCSGTQVTASDRRLYAPVFLTISLRNRTN